MFASTTLAFASIFSVLSYASPLSPLEKRAVPYGTIIYNCATPTNVALTFDDGPYIYTNDILDKLKAAGMRATFFINGDNYDNIYNYNSTIRRYITDGHQIGSHTWSHKDLTTLSVANINLEMTKLEDALMSILGYFPFYMRAPYLAYSSTVLSTLGTLKYVVVDNDINPQDWKYNTLATTSTAQSQFNTQLTAGGRLCEMHDPQAVTASNLVPYAIALLQSKGLTSVPVGECLGEPSNNWYRTNRDGGYPPVSSSSSSAVKSSTSTAASSSVVSSSSNAASSTSPAASSSTQASSTAAASSTIASTSSSTVASSSVGSSSTVASSSAQASPSGVVSPDSTCGGTNKYICPTGRCCSKYGWCGATTAYCGTGCQPLYGVCAATTGGTSPDGTCGPANGYICPTPECCSQYGFCGTTADYCAAASGCQAAFGAACT